MSLPILGSTQKCCLLSSPAFRKYCKGLFPMLIFWPFSLLRITSSEGRHSHSSCKHLTLKSVKLNKEIAEKQAGGSDTGAPCVEERKPVTRNKGIKHGKHLSLLSRSVWEAVALRETEPLHSGEPRLQQLSAMPL